MAKPAHRLRRFGEIIRTPANGRKAEEQVIFQ
jgi:hypothetical protein